MGGVRRTFIGEDARRRGMDGAKEDTAVYRISCKDCPFESVARDLDEMEAVTEIHMRLNRHTNISIVEESNE